MSWDPIHLVRRVGVVVLVAFLCHPAFAQKTSAPEQLLAEAERLAWLKAWTKAEPLYTAAEREFASRGDRRNALYAQISALRGQLPHLPVPDVSERLAKYLEDPLVLADDRLRLRSLIIKGETDEDLDPSLSEQSWNEALALAEKLGEPAWANRARGELGLVAFLSGDINNAVIRLGQALKVAESNGDVASLVRWLTLFGHGYVQLDRSEQALDFYDRALKIASTVRELQFPVMTYLGKGNALARLGRSEDAKRVLAEALAVAEREGAFGYQAEVTLQQGLIAYQEKNTPRALELLAQATDLAVKAGGNRILAEIALQAGRIQREGGRFSDSESTLKSGIDVARNMGEHLLLPRLLATLADLRVSQHKYTEARDLLDEAADVLEGLLTNASSPWVRSRVIGSMDSVFLARVRLEGSQGQSASRLFTVIEQARGRSVLELLSAHDSGKKPAELQTGERRIAAFQLRLLRTKDKAERQRLLDEILRAEEQLAPVSTEVFTRTRVAARKPLGLREVQRKLRHDEVLLEFVLAEPNSFVVVSTRTSARIHRLVGRAAIQKALEPIVRAVREGSEAGANARQAGELLLDGVSELNTRTRVIVSADGPLHQVPLELMVMASGKRLLESHVVSYVPSGSVLSFLRRVQGPRPSRRVALAVSASPAAEAPVPVASSGSPAFGTIARGIYDLDATQLPPLPSANDEARAVATTLGAAQSTILIGDSATEQELKHQPLNDYRVLHFAAHGIVSTKFPARSALLLKPSGTDDGLLQAREILEMRLDADLVTLSACDTGSGAVYGQDGVASLVRPFLAVGARSVVANLWTADDRFSLALMREFYRQLAAGVDVGEAMRRTKMKMLEQFGSQAVPKLWSGVLVYGDGAAVLRRSSATAETGGASAGRK
jgi:CHAT domain-containing protein/tetratricopeptide (TPR) repeat protein